MPNMEFRVKPHGELSKGHRLHDHQMVELWRGGVFVAGIYPHEDGIRIISKYLDGVKHEPEYPPTVVVHLSKIASV